MKLIGLTGPAGSGKDTVARFLCDTQGFVQVAFADAMRDGLKAMFGLTDEELSDRTKKEDYIPWLGRSPRYLMQTLGTTWGRNCIKPDLWVQLAARKVEAHRRSSPCLHINGIVLSDVRFEDEAAYVRGQGTLWHIHRTTMAYTGLASSALQHISEQGVAWLPCDRTIHNSGSIDDLYETVANVFSNEE